MKKLAIAILSSLLAVSMSLSASAADENWPAAPTPNWAATSPLTGVRLAQWLPCKVEWKSTTDCIEGIKWSKLDGSATGESTFVANPNFNPMTAVQTWEVATGPNGEKIDNYGHFSNTEVGYWLLPAGFKNTDGSERYEAYAHVMNSSLQFTATAFDKTNVGLPANSIIEMTLRTKSFQPYVGWIVTTVKDPSVKVFPDKIVLAGNPTGTPWASGSDVRICSSNNLKASSTTTSIAMNLFYNSVGQGVVDPGDLILGTNGWWCISDLRFDNKTQTMHIGVGNSHFDENGKVIEGWFDFKVKGSRAKQWWGMDPEVATGFVKVEVVYEDGTSVVATTQAKYDKTNDWISIQSQGFHYSSPAVQVSFKKAEVPVVVTPPVEETKPVVEVTPIPVAKAPTKAPVVKKSTITCVKGKTTRKVTGLKPTCPKGFKRK